VFIDIFMAVLCVKHSHFYWVSCQNKKSCFIKVWLWLVILICEDIMHHVVIVGGGFGGLYAAKQLGRLGRSVRVTLIDKRNFHLFQPLLYQVATGGLSPGDIASPLRAVLRHYSNISVIQSEVFDIRVSDKTVVLKEGEVTYDTLILSAGVSHSYFGNEQWQKYAPGLKTVEDALDIRHRVFQAFEKAEQAKSDSERMAWMTFVLVGAGPTGVELAGAVAELAFATLVKDFRNIDTKKTKIILLEGADRVLPPFAEGLSDKAQKSLERLGVQVQTKAMVTDIQADCVVYKKEDAEYTIATHTVLWAAGMKASPLSAVLKRETGAELDRQGRVVVAPDLSVPQYADILVIGDLACYQHQGERPLPGVAPVAMQMGRYAACLIRNRIKGHKSKPFRYVDKGSLAVIGRNAAVADLGFIKFSGFFAWFAWVFIHIAYLIEYDNRLLVLFQWAWNYVTRKRGARLITGKVDG
jgi:NADH dehydrogenase